MTAASLFPILLVELPDVLHFSIQQPGPNRPVSLFSSFGFPKMIVVLINAFHPKHELVRCTQQQSVAAGPSGTFSALWRTSWLSPEACHQGMS
jgi:hypothetical protein